LIRTCGKELNQKLQNAVTNPSSASLIDGADQTLNGGKNMKRTAPASKASQIIRIAAIASAAGAAVCAIAYNLIGSHIAADGMLVEPFYLIPLFWLLAVFGAACWLISFILEKAFR
jgi:hypothetical protein